MERTIQLEYERPDLQLAQSRPAIREHKGNVGGEIATCTGGLKLSLPGQPDRPDKPEPCTLEELSHWPAGLGHYRRPYSVDTRNQNCWGVPFLMDCC